MKEHPLSFTAEQVRALLAGRLTQTRRTGPNHWLWESEYRIRRSEWDKINWADSYLHTFPSGRQCVRVNDGNGQAELWPRIQPGDLIWARETWQLNHIVGDNRRSYPETYSGAIPKSKPYFNPWVEYRANPESEDEGPWRSPIHMPRWASRITLRVTDVRVQRVQDISEADAIAEGCPDPDEQGRYIGPHEDDTALIPSQWFANTWNTIYGPDAWARNDWVIAYTFERVDA